VRLNRAPNGKFIGSGDVIICWLPVLLAALAWGQETSKKPLPASPDSAIHEWSTTPDQSSPLCTSADYLVELQGVKRGGKDPHVIHFLMTIFIIWLTSMAHLWFAHYLFKSLAERITAASYAPPQTQQPPGEME
jgi:hypothetical protein